MADKKLDQTISDWLEAEAPKRVSDRVLRATFQRTRKTRQQVGWRVLPRRLSMPRFVPALTGAAIVLVVGAVAFSLYLNRPSVAVNPSPTPSAIPSAATSGGMWPQATLEEVRAAQEAADAGDPAYTWQVDPPLDQQGGRSWLYIVEGQPDIADRFIREVLGWDEYMVNVYPRRADDNGGSDGVFSDIGYLRCASGGGKPLEQGDACTPTLDALHYETVGIDLAQLDRQGPDGIWVVSNWTITPPYAPVTQVTALVESFLGARVDGHGAEGLVYTAEGTDVPLMYVTSTGATYERYELDLVRGPGWAMGEIDFKVRLFADGGQTVVEQEIQWWYLSPAELHLSVAKTTENGQFVTVRYGFLDGMATASAKYPWERSCGQDCLAWWSGSGAGYISLTVGPVTVTDGCLEDATEPVSVNIGGLPAVVMDGTGGTECGLFGDWVGRGRPVRIYVVDLPEGSPMPNLAIAVGAEGAPFDDVIEAATPIIESIEFLMP